MRFFKKKPKPDIMGFISCETSLKRCQLMIDAFHDEALRLNTYLYSTAMIQKNLKVQYSEEIIRHTMMNCDKFFIKKYKQFKDVNLEALRKQVANELEGDYVSAFLARTGLNDHDSVIENSLKEWNDAMLLISDDIKSM